MNDKMQAAWAQYGVKFDYPEEHYNYAHNTPIHVNGVVWDKLERGRRECAANLFLECKDAHALRLMDPDARKHLTRSVPFPVRRMILDCLEEIA